MGNIFLNNASKYSKQFIIFTNEKKQITIFLLLSFMLSANSNKDFIGIKTI